MRTALDLFWVIAPLALGGTWIVTSIHDQHAGYLIAGIALVWLSGGLAALTISERWRGR